MNAHEIILNMKNDKIIFKFDRCFHFETFKVLKIRNERSIFFRKIYFSSSTSSIKQSISINFQKYRIIQRRSFSFSFKIKFSFFIVENFENDEKLFLKNILNFSFRYAIEKIEKKYFFVKFSREKRRIKIIQNFQQFTFVEIFVRKSNLVKKFARRFSRRFKISIFVNENDEQNFDFDVFLNVVFIDVVVYQFLAESKERRKRIKTFSLIMKKLNEIIDNVKENLIKTKFDFDFDFKKVFKIIKTIVEKLKRKIFDFFKRLS